MFLQFLNERQRKELLVLAHKLTAADGEDAPEEEEALRKLMAEAGIETPVPAERIVGTIDVTVFDTRESKAATMLQVLVLAFSDEFLHPAESKFLGTLAGAMGFSQEEFNPMVDWAYRYGIADRGGDRTERDTLLHQAKTLIQGGG